MAGLGKLIALIIRILTGEKYQKSSLHEWAAFCLSGPCIGGFLYLFSVTEPMTRTFSGIQLWLWFMACAFLFFVSLIPVLFLAFRLPPAVSAIIGIIGWGVTFYLCIFVISNR